jgi:hypothetical protein
MNSSEPISDKAWMLVQGELDAPTAAQVRAALESSAEGRATLREADITHRLLQRRLVAPTALEERITQELDRDLRLDEKPSASGGSAGGGHLLSFPVWAGWASSAVAACLLIGMLGPMYFGPSIRWSSTQIMASTTGETFRGVGAEGRARDLSKAVDSEISTRDVMDQSRWRISIKVELGENEAETYIVEAGPARWGAAKTDSWVLKVQNEDEFKAAYESFAKIIADQLAGKAKP